MPTASRMLWWRDLDDFAVFLDDLHRLRIDEAGLAAHMLNAVAGKLVFQHLDLVIKGDQQTAAQILAR